MKAPAEPTRIHQFRQHHKNGVKKPSKMKQLITLITKINGQDSLLNVMNGSLAIFFGWLGFVSKFVDEDSSTLIAVGLFILILSMSAVNLSTAYIRVKKGNTKKDNSEDNQSNYKG